MQLSTKIVLALCVFNPAASFLVQNAPVQSSSLGSWAGTKSAEKSETYTFPSTSANVGSTSVGPTPDKIAYVSEKVAPSDKSHIKNMWDTLSPTTVQGGSLRTWSFASSAIERVQVMLRTDGRPLHANIELWQGPDNTPVKMQVYNEDGCMRPFCAIVETPRGQNSIAIRNTGQMEFPLAACLGVDVGGVVGNGKADLGAITRGLAARGAARTIQGGALHTYPFDASVSSVQIMVKTDGRPLNARIELIQGPNNNKQVVDLYTEDGMERPFFAIIETPGIGNVVRIVNTAPLEFPMNVRIEPYQMEKSMQPQNGESFFIMDKAL
jgi:hypothetical protein